MIHWAEHMVTLQPLTRQLEEAFNFQQYKNAERIISKLQDALHELYLHSLREDMKRAYERR